ncbi:MAG TPA: SRPBCC family protein [Usitatibacter sp.]|jgi:uncharacterized protein|nr:SRPBCC family protein [Usitatibacter sp.]
MKVRLEKTLALPGGAEAAWQALQDIEAVAACMPGARITERIDPTHYKGTVSMKVGPASMSFRGDLEVRQVDAAARTLQLLAKGVDGTGTSGASMELNARVEGAEAGASRLVGVSEVSMSGKAAAFGGRLINSVADQVLDQFANNFAARVASVEAATPPPAVAANAPGTELNGLAIALKAFRAWLRSLFSKAT